MEGGRRPYHCEYGRNMSSGETALVENGLGNHRGMPPACPQACTALGRDSGCRKESGRRQWLAVWKDSEAGVGMDLITHTDSMEISNGTWPACWHGKLVV